MAECECSNSTLAATACWTAAVRARESRREDGLFHDPWAEALAGDQGASWIAQRPEDSTIPMVLRTRYFDDFLEQIASLEEIRQVVLLAAGFDTRAFRLKWPAGVCVFEMDQPSVMDYKESVLQSLGATAVCERLIIRKDLTGSWKEALVARVRSSPAFVLSAGRVSVLPFKRNGDGDYRFGYAAIRARDPVGLRRHE